MRIKLDENFPISAKSLLTRLGHSCHTVFDENIQGVSDERLIGICRAESRVLFILDLDFSNIIVYPPDQYSGIVIFRLSQQDTDFVLTRVAKVMHVLSELELDSHLLIVNDSRIRYR